jgi:hypothetical protein
MELFYNTSGASTGVARQRREALWLLGSIGRSWEPLLTDWVFPTSQGGQVTTLGPT